MEPDNVKRPGHEQFIFLASLFLSVFGILTWTVSAKDRGDTKIPAVDLGTNFDASTFYQDASSVLSRSTEYSTQLFSSRPYFTQNMVDQKC